MLSLVVGTTTGVGQEAPKPEPTALQAKPQPQSSSTILTEAAKKLPTIAESSEYKATSTSAQVVSFCDSLAQSYPQVVHRTSLGTSHEGKDIPLLILSNPLVTDASVATKRAKEQEQLIFLAIGNIHAGEVDGKEALLALARDLAAQAVATPQRTLLNNCVFVIVPNFNPDGNDRFEKGNRPGQVGPENGQGQRENAQGFDLNRDFIKLESPEARALVAFMNSWDPDIFIDAHTTDGSFHRYIMTYAGIGSMSGEPELVDFSREELLPQIGERFKHYGKESGWESFFYGNFDAEFEAATNQSRKHTRWETFPAEGRYAVRYVGLRSRFSILTESYSYAPYKDRVLAHTLFIRSALEESLSKRPIIRGLIEVADERTLLAGKVGGHPVSIRSKMVAAPTPVTVKGYVERFENGRSLPTSEHAEYTVEHFDRFESALDVPRPVAYIMPPTCSHIAEKLLQHGIPVQQIAQAATLQVGSYTITKAQPASRIFQGHTLLKIEAKIHEPAPKDIPAGSFLISTHHTLGNLIVYLLEPQSEDGLAVWNYFDAYLKPESEYPVWRLMDAATLPSITTTRYEVKSTPKPQ